MSPIHPWSRQGGDRLGKDGFCISRGRQSLLLDEIVRSFREPLTWTRLGVPGVGDVSNNTYWDWDDDVDARIGLAPYPASAARARRFIRKRLAQWGRKDLGDTAALLTSELVTNAILHAGTYLVLKLSLGAQGLKVMVVDGSAEPPTRRQHRDDPEGGMGLQLVEALADSWGVSRRDSGKEIWFQVA